MLYLPRYGNSISPLLSTFNPLEVIRSTFLSDGKSISTVSPGPIIYSGNELSNNGSNTMFLKSAGILPHPILGYLELEEITKRLQLMTTQCYFLE